VTVLPPRSVSGGGRPPSRVRSAQVNPAKAARERRKQQQGAGEEAGAPAAVVWSLEQEGAGDETQQCNAALGALDSAKLGFDALQILEDFEQEQEQEQQQHTLRSLTMRERPGSAAGAHSGAGR